MTTAAELIALAERCEREEPSAALNFAIWEAVYARRAPVGTFEEWVAPAYTASLDAAVTLVPDGWSWFCEGPASISAAAHIWNPSARASAEYRSLAKTPALALCAAALRARAAILKVPTQ